MFAIGSLDGTEPCCKCGRKIKKGEFGVSTFNGDLCRECADKVFSKNPVKELAKLRGK